jgi:hypothetical protein
MVEGKLGKGAVDTNADLSGNPKPLDSSSKLHDDISAKPPIADNYTFGQFKSHASSEA